MTEPLVITRVTHSCHLIQVGGLTVLTDPWFSQRALYHPGEPIAFQPEQLPHLDAVVISHEHYDHCDLDAFRRYPDKDVPLLVAGPVVEKARKAGFSNVRALEPWQSAQVGDLTISAAPGKHGVYEVTYVISGGGRSVYFAGDTLLIPELRTLTDRYGPLDVALLPVNGLQHPDGGQQAGRHERRRGRRAHRRPAPQAGGTAALRLHQRHRGRHALPQERQGPPPTSSRRPAAWPPTSRSRSSAPANR